MLRRQLAVTKETGEWAAFTNHKSIQTLPEVVSWRGWLSRGGDGCLVEGMVVSSIQDHLNRACL